MSINLSGMSDDVVYGVNPAIHTVYFAALCLPAFFLFLFSILALLRAKTMNINLRIILLSVFIAELSQILGYMVLFLGHPFRVEQDGSRSQSCNFAMSATLCGESAKLPATALYAISVYVYIKKGPRNLKYYAIVATIVASWVASFSVSVIPYAVDFSVVSNHGFCYLEAKISTIIALGFIVAYGVCIGTTIVFGVLTLCYVKRKTSKNRVRAQKIITKILIYLIVGSVISLFHNIVPPLLSLADSYLKGSVSGFIHLVAFYISNALLLFLLILTPIVTLVLLRSVRNTLLHICCVMITECLGLEIVLSTVAAPAATLNQLPKTDRVHLSTLREPRPSDSEDVFGNRSRSFRLASCSPVVPRKISADKTREVVVDIESVSNFEPDDQDTHPKPATKSQTVVYLEPVTDDKTLESAWDSEQDVDLDYSPANEPGQAANCHPVEDQEPGADPTSALNLDPAAASQPVEDQEPATDPLSAVNPDHSQPVNPIPAPGPGPEPNADFQPVADQEPADSESV